MMKTDSRSHRWNRSFQYPARREDRTRVRLMGKLSAPQIFWGSSIMIMK
ncbi:hypothetical protein BPP3_50 [Escherichia phage CLB_P3]|nr:hypothetical protein BPP3_50 [Escherichia phage CLB_P3]